MTVKIYGSNRIDLDGNNETFSIRATADDELNFYKGASTKLMGMDASGFESKPNIPAFYGSNISPTTAGRFALVNNVLLNNGNHIINTAPDGNNRTRFIAPVNGIYFTWMSNIGESVTEILRMHFYINGIIQYAQLRNAVTTNHGTSASMVGIFEMNAGDYLEWDSSDQYGWYSNLYAHVGCYLIG